MYFVWKNDLVCFEKRSVLSIIAVTSTLSILFHGTAKLVLRPINFWAPHVDI